MICMKRFMIKPIILLALLALVGCDSIPFMNSAPDYKGAGRAKPLEVPPDLTAVTSSDAYAVPGGSTSYSSYSQQGQDGQDVGVEKILPNAEGVTLHRSGHDRWLVVNAPAEKIWPVIREFWLDMGFAVRVERPEIGVMETEWIESDALKVEEKGSYGDKFDKWLDKLSGYADRRKFRTRLDNGAEAGTTEIYMTHRTVSSAPDDGKNKIQTQLGEIDTGYRADASKAKDANVTDDELDVELLRRLMVKLGLDASQAKQIASAPIIEKHAQLLKDTDGSAALLLNDSFDRGWRRVGLALDRVGFVIEDKDRSNGLFFVRYSDIDVATGDKKKKGLLETLKFWGNDKPSDSVEISASDKKSDDKSNAAKQYSIKVIDVAEGSKVTVENKDGSRNRSATANKILALLFEELK